MTLVVKKNFEVYFLSEARDFLNTVPQKAKEKIVSNIDKSRYLLDAEYFKKLTGSDIWEFRTIFRGTRYRMLAFWDKGTNSLVIVTNGFVKKTQKTPEVEIRRAEKLMRKYYEIEK